MTKRIEWSARCNCYNPDHQHRSHSGRCQERNVEGPSGVCEGCVTRLVKDRIRDRMHPDWKVAPGPKTGRWYIFERVREGTWTTVGQPHDTEVEALRHWAAAAEVE